MKNKRKIILRTLLLLPFVAVLAIWLFSSYKSHNDLPYKAIASSVEINASPEVVFEYLGHSERAGEWSVFVHHITPFNTDSFADGVVGCRRRCFCNKDETGTIWDEVITEVEPGKRRQLTIYNMKGFAMTADGLYTEQRYTPLDGGKRCKLTLSLFYKNREPGIWDLFKTHLSSWRAERIFGENLANIKRNIERGS
ncbi:MAG: SRPBCC family protein [Bacteroidia bacterium]